MNTEKSKKLSNFSDLTVKLTKLNRVFLDRIEYDLSYNDISDITPMQALVLKNIHESRGKITMMEKSGYYTGKNPTYSLKSLIDKGYITKKNHPYDARCMKFSLTVEGKRVISVINSSFLLQNETLTKLGEDDNFIPQTSDMIDKLLGMFDIK